MPEKPYVAERTTPADPWAVYEMLTDREQQAQWRGRFDRLAPVAEATPYTRVRFEDGFVVDLEPDGTGTRLVGSLPVSGSALSRVFTSRRSRESELADHLARITGALEYGDM